MYQHNMYIAIVVNDAPNLSTTVHIVLHWTGHDHITYQTQLKQTKRISFIDINSILLILCTCNKTWLYDNLMCSHVYHGTES